MAPYFTTAGDRLLEALDRGEDPFAQAAEARILRAFNTPVDTTTAGPDLKQVSGTVYAGSHEGTDGELRILWVKYGEKMYPTGQIPHG